jgi:hypothetical protein
VLRVSSFELFFEHGIGVGSETFHVGIFCALCVLSRLKKSGSSLFAPVGQAGMPAPQLFSLLGRIGSSTSLKTGDLFLSDASEYEKNIKTPAGGFIATRAWGSGL